MVGRSLATNQQINSIVFDEARVWPRYGFYACKLLKPKLEGMAPATTVAIVNKSKFEALEILVPPLNEQKRIAAILDQPTKFDGCGSARLTGSTSSRRRFSMRCLVIQYLIRMATKLKRWALSLT